MFENLVVDGVGGGDKVESPVEGSYRTLDVTAVVKVERKAVIDRVDDSGERASRSWDNGKKFLKTYSIHAMRHHITI